MDDPNPLGDRPDKQGLATQVMFGAISRRMFPEQATPVRIGRFVIIDQLGAGGMGVVFKAYDPELDRRVAVKVVRTELESSADAPAAQRMLREAKALARLSHPYVVAVHDVGFTDDGVYIAMEYVEGLTLGEYCEQHPSGERRQVQRILALGRQAAQALTAAHAAGLVHRDLKPSNLLVGADGRLRVVDFGLARTEDDGDDELVRDPATMVPTMRELSRPLTATGELVGTPAYMAPEQFRGQVDALSDQFAWGVTFWEALYGERPFRGATAGELVAAMMDRRIESPPPGRRVPSRVRRILERTLAVDPHQRFPDMAAVVAALTAEQRRSRASSVALGVAAVGGLVVLGVRELRDDRCRGVSEVIDAQWNDATRSKLAQALAGAGDSGAWTRIEPALAAYVESWKTARKAACEAGDRDLPSIAITRLACLEGRRHALREWLRVLGGIDEVSVSRAVASTSELPTLAECGDTQWLAAQVKPPSDPGTKIGVDQARESLASARAHEAIGEFTEAFAIADAQVDVAERLDYAPLLAEAWSARAAAEHGLGRDQDAIEDHRQAFLLATRAGDDGLATKAAATIAFVYAEELRDHPMASHWMDLAGAMLARSADPDGSLGAYVASRRAVMWHRAGDYANAVAAAKLAIEGYSSSRGADDNYVLTSMATLVNAYAAQNEFAAATSTAEAALRMADATLGPASLRAANLHNSMCMASNHAGQLEAAQRHCEAAYEILVALRGPKHAELVVPVTNLGMLAGLRDEHERALGYYREALALLEAAGRDSHPNAMQLWLNIAASLDTLGRTDEVHDAIDRAIAIGRGNPQADRETFAAALYSAGVVAEQAGHVREAGAYLEEALAAMPATAGDDPVIVYGQAFLGRVRLAQGAPERALPLLEAAVGAFERTSYLDVQLGAQARFDLARALVGTDRDRALDLASMAHEQLVADSEDQREVEAFVRRLGGELPPRPAVP